MIAAVLLFLSLGLDTFAVALGLGVSGLPRSQWRRVGLVFAFFEGVMPMVGLFVGSYLSHAVGRWAGYGAAALLILVGGHEIKESFSDDEKLPSVTGAKIILAGLSVSLDELAVGFSLGVLHVPVSLALGVIALQAFALTFAGLGWGTRFGSRFGERAELAGGILLTLLGLALLLNQYTGSRFL